MNVRNTMCGLSGLKIFQNVDPHAMFKMYVNIILTSARYVPNTLFSSRFACNAAIFPNVTVLTLPLFMAFAEDRKFFKLPVLQLFQFSVTSSHLDPNTVFMALFSNTFITCSSLNVSPILIKQSCLSLCIIYNRAD